MKKTLKKVNLVIVAMFVVLIGLAVNNSKTLNVQTDSRVIYAGDTSKNNVCFMINVYQNNEYVKNMLDIMDVYNVKTTFFVGGSYQ